MKMVVLVVTGNNSNSTEDSAENTGLGERRRRGESWEKGDRGESRGNGGRKAQATGESRGKGGMRLVAGQKRTKKDVDVEGCGTSSPIAARPTNTWCSCD